MRQTEKLRRRITISWCWDAPKEKRISGGCEGIKSCQAEKGTIERWNKRKRIIILLFNWENYETEAELQPDFP